jgi:hypothetical protein
MTMGFPVSVLARLAVGIAFTTGTGVLVWGIERPRNHDTAGAVTSVPAVSAGHSPALSLTIESTYSVATWTVQILGRNQTAQQSDSTSWSGMVSLTPDDEVFIQAQAKPVAAGQEDLPHHGLLIRLGTQPDRFIWSRGDVTATAGLSP